MIGEFPLAYNIHINLLGLFVFKLNSRLLNKWVSGSTVVPSSSVTSTLVKLSNSLKLKIVLNVSLMLSFVNFNRLSLFLRFLSESISP